MKKQQKALFRSTDSVVQIKLHGLESLASRPDETGCNNLSLELVKPTYELKFSGNDD